MKPRVHTLPDGGIVNSRNSRIGNFRGPFGQNNEYDYLVSPNGLFTNALLTVEKPIFRDRARLTIHL